MEDSIGKISVCPHGGLRHKCETCDLADRLDVAEAHVRELEWEVVCLKAIMKGMADEVRHVSVRLANAAVSPADLKAMLASEGS